MPKGNPGIPKSEEHRKNMRLACEKRSGHDIWQSNNHPELLNKCEKWFKKNLK